MRFMLALTSLLLFLPAAAVAAKDASPPLTDEERVVVQTYDAPAAKQDAIHKAALAWATQTLTGYKENLVEYDNPQEGVLVINPSVPYQCKGYRMCLGAESATIRFSMKIDTKDGKLRTTFTNVRAFWPAKSSNGFGIREPSSEYPVVRSEFELIRPLLLGYGEAIVATLNKYSNSGDW